MHEGALVDVSTFLIAFLVLIIGAKIGAEIAERWGQPSVLGEILAGIIIGATGFGLITHDPVHGVYHVFSLVGERATATHQALDVLAEIGVIVLLFEIGLHCDLYELRRVGKSALWVGVAGVVLPFVGGFFGSRYLLHFDFYPALFTGAALTATSVGITARVFQDMKMLKTAESQIVLGAAVADDVIGLIILAVVAALIPVAGAVVTVNPWIQGIKVTVLAVGFLVAALVIGVRFVPAIEKIIAKTKSRGGITVAALAFCLFVAILGQMAGLAMIIGAFTAGLVLSHSNVKEQIQESIKPIADIFIPLFFAMTGTVINLRALAQGPELLWISAVLIVIAVTGKVLGCLTLPDKTVSKLVIGLAMIPRGEVGLIYARLGIQNGWISGIDADGLIMMVIATTLMTPPLLRQSMLGLKKQRGEEITPDMLQKFPASRSGIDRDNWEVFDVDAMLMLQKVRAESENNGHQSAELVAK